MIGEFTKLDNQVRLITKKSDFSDLLMLLAIFRYI